MKITHVSQMPTRGVYSLGSTFCRIILDTRPGPNTRVFVRYYTSEEEATSDDDWNPGSSYPLNRKAWFMLNLYHADLQNMKLVLLRDDESEIPS